MACKRRGFVVGLQWFLLTTNTAIAMLLRVRFLHLLLLKGLTFVLLATSLPAPLVAQTPVSNHEKYWRYRDRLLNRFLVSSAGNERGTSMPAAMIHTEKGYMRWGDATIHLSNYLAVLATEYKLLTLKGLPTGQTLLELHRALLAKERLDADAPGFFDYESTDSILDGFFIRDDVPPDFTVTWSEKYPDFANYPSVRSDYNEWDIRLNEMSQDQVWNLIVGLALVSHLVDDTTTYVIPRYYGQQPLSLADRAMIISHRIIRSLQTQVCLFRPGFLDDLLCIHYWHLYNPYFRQSVKRGSGPYLLKYGFAEAGNVITDYRFGDMHWGNSHNAKIWFTLAEGVQYVQRLKKEKNIENLYHTATTATVGGVWSTQKLVRLFNRHKKFPLRPDPQYEHLALISCVLHGDCPPILQEEQAYYESLMNQAPPNGPFNYGVDYEPDPDSPLYYEHWQEYTYEWSASNRFVWPQRRGNGTSEFFTGEYNGLDYMLLYNLYGLVYGHD